MGRESVKSFLRQCIEYAEKSIQRKQKRGDEKEVIQAWETYLEFTTHALKEVDASALAVVQNNEQLLGVFRYVITGKLKT